MIEWSRFYDLQAFIEYLFYGILAYRTVHDDDRILLFAGTLADKDTKGPLFRRLMLIGLSRKLFEAIGLLGTENAREAYADITGVEFERVPKFHIRALRFNFAPYL